MTDIVRVHARHSSLIAQKNFPRHLLARMPGEGDGWTIGTDVEERRQLAGNYEADCSDVATFVNVVFALVPID